MFDNNSLFHLLEVSILTTNMIRKRESIVKHIEYEAPVDPAVVDAFMGKYSTGKERAGLTSYFPFARLMMKGYVKTCKELVSNVDTLNEIKNADMIVSTSMFCCSTYIADIFDKPIIYVHPGPLALIGPWAQVPLPPSYVPLIGSGTTDDMTFMQRTKNLVVSNIKSVLLDAFVTYHFKTFQKEMGSTSTQSYAQLFGKAELYIIASVDFVFEYAHPLMPSRFFFYIYKQGQIL